MAIVVGALLAACAPRVAELPRESGRPPGFPEQEYRRASAEGKTVFRVDPSASLVTIAVGRAGSLARLAHDHVVASHDVRGYVLPGAGRADLYIALDRLVVDEPELRTAAGLTAEIPPDAIAGTRRNMLDKVLEAERFPFALVRLASVDERAGLANAAITLHGVTREIRIPVNIQRQAGSLDASGQFTLAQSDFGIAPLSILGGAIQVQDKLDIHFSIHASAPD